MTRKFIPLFTLINFLMIGCGQIGALYLPEQEQENNRTAISTNTTRSEITDVQ